MPEVRPGAGVYVKNTTASAALTNGQVVKEGNFVGIAVKQKARSWKDGYTIQKTIDDDEDYFLITKGVVLVPDTGNAFAQGAAVYITSANALTATATGNAKFGRVVEDENVRGVPTDKVRVDLDSKDSF